MGELTIDLLLQLTLGCRLVDDLLKDSWPSGRWGVLFAAPAWRWKVIGVGITSIRLLKN